LSAGNPETRKTALFSYLLAGVPFLLWDNIPRVTSLDCDHINAALTSAIVSDRLFHTQTVRDAAATTIQVFTGNGVVASGDMRSRVLRVALHVDREDPENRPFERPDPLQWTRENRASILRDLYTILCVKTGPASREKTRMKKWWRMIGHPIELVTGVDFEAMISESGGIDPIREGRATVVRMLMERFGQSAFYARDVAHASYAAGPDDDAESDAIPPTAKPAWTGEEIERFRDAMQTAMGAKEDIARSGRLADYNYWTAQRIGRRLQSLADMPVVVEHCTMTLRARRSPDKRGTAFSIEVDV
jgi:hypothetical protein